MSRCNLEISAKQFCEMEGAKQTSFEYDQVKFQAKTTNSMLFSAVTTTQSEGR